MYHRGRFSTYRLSKVTHQAIKPECKDRSLVRGATLDTGCPVISCGGKETQPLLEL